MRDIMSCDFNRDNKSFVAFQDWISTFALRAIGGLRCDAQNVYKYVRLKMWKDVSAS